MTGRQSHDIEYRITGSELQSVEIILDPGESVVAEAGAMMYMDDAIHMEAILGDGSPVKSGVLGKLVSAGARAISGESFFMTQFTNHGQDKRAVGFATPHPGTVLAIDLAQHGGQLLAQKEAFLCAAKGTKLGLGIHKRIGAGFFGGEGFIMQKLVGDGLAFIHAGGAVIERELAAGEVLRIDNGCLMAMDAQADYDVEMIKGIKSMLFSGEGVFLARVKGPGRVWMQSLPYGRTIEMIKTEIMANMPSNRK